jgi:serine/threonine-protein kinase
MLTVRPERATSGAVGPASRITYEELPVVSLGGPLGLGRFDDAALGLKEHDSELVVREVLGVGGMGRVLLGRQRSLGRDVAIKVLHETSLDRDSLVREARIVGALEHPNVVPVHLLARSERGDPIFVMKRVEGVRWLDLIERPDHPHWKHIQSGDDRRLAHLEIFCAVANAVALAHERGIVHRDIKPENVMLGSFGEVYLTDWGIALDLQGELVSADAPFAGTPSYAAPEMLGGDERAIGPATDVYLLGATLHHALLGRPRHEGEVFMQVVASVVMSAPYDYGTDVPGELATLLNAATSRLPEERPTSAIALRDAVRDHVRHREARALVARATLALEALERGDRAAVERSMLAIRIALEEASRVWPSNAELEPLFVRALRAFARVEREQEHLSRLRALVEELAALGEDTTAELTLVDELESRNSMRAAREAKLAAIERDHDLSVSSLPRMLLLVGTVILVLGIGGVVAAMRLSQRPSALAPAALSAFGLVAFGVVAGVGRKRLLVNRANRGVMATIGSGLLFLALHRAIALRLGTSSSEVVALDCAGMAALLCIASLLAFPKLWPGAVAFGIGSLVLVLAPALSPPVFVVSMLIAALSGVRAWSGRSRLESEPEERGSSPPGE